MTLREIWEARRMTATEVAAAARITTVTLYKMNRKESVRPRTIRDVCRVLAISIEDYEALDAE